MHRNLTLGKILDDNLISSGYFEYLKTEKIYQITFDSRELNEFREGQDPKSALFFALSGENFDGHDFIDDVFLRNPRSIVISERPLKNLYQRSIRVHDINKTMAYVAKKFYGSPDEKLNIIGITGTNGKTTTAYLCQSMLSAVRKTGMFSTVKCDVGGCTKNLPNTTPAAIRLFGLINESILNGCKNLVLEVSSHALAQKRAYGLKVDIAIFTNLTPEHLDFHKTMDEYFCEKIKLFDGSNGHHPSSCVVNIDDPYGKKLVKILKKLGKKIHTFGFSDDADFRIYDVETDNLTGLKFKIRNKKDIYDFRSPLFGRHNLLNICGGFVACLEANFSPKEFVGAISDFCGLSGRLERINLGNGVNVFIDYAHTPHALEVVIGSLNMVKKGRLITVFGCGGHRDSSKRSPMTRISNSLSDFTIATSDNPRQEKQDDIFSDMKKGVCVPENITFIANRKDAIFHAISMAKPGDIILIAGKGHENYQIIGDQVFEFDDKKIVLESQNCQK